MGGHGALICALKTPGFYSSVSAFAPICAPTECAWGKKALGGYLGPDESKWAEYDACRLVSKYSGPPIGILVSQVQFLIKNVHFDYSCVFRVSRINF